jgi:hypothetical protein
MQAQPVSYWGQPTEGGLDEPTALLIVVALVVLAAAWMLAGLPILVCAAVETVLVLRR